jgi:SAM-dependent methyltransferase
MPEGRYMIRGGTAGRDRLRVLHNASVEGMTALLDDVGIEPGARCLDAGCGGGDVTLELARRAGPNGFVVGMDLDEAKLAVARAEAAAAGVDHLQYVCDDVMSAAIEPVYDVVHARFLLTHLPDPLAGTRQLARAVRPGGVLALMDIDFTAIAMYPRSAAYDRFVELYLATARARGGDPYVGLRLGDLLTAAGLEHVRMRAAQPAGRRPAGLEGDVKRIPALTMQLIAEATVGEGLATADEVQATLEALEAVAADTTTLVLLPRTIAAWARRGPAALAAEHTPLPSATQTAPAAIASGVVALTRRMLGRAVAPGVQLRPASSVSYSCDEGSSSSVLTTATACDGFAGSATMRSTCPPGVGPDGDHGGGAAVAATGVRARAAAVATRTRTGMT